MPVTVSVSPALASVMSPAAVNEAPLVSAKIVVPAASVIEPADSIEIDMAKALAPVNSVLEASLTVAERALTVSVPKFAATAHADVDGRSGGERSVAADVDRVGRRVSQDDASHRGK